MPQISERAWARPAFGFYKSWCPETWSSPCPCWSPGGKFWTSSACDTPTPPANPFMEVSADSFRVMSLWTLPRFEMIDELIAATYFEKCQVHGPVLSGQGSFAKGLFPRICETKSQGCGFASFRKRTLQGNTPRKSEDLALIPSLVRTLPSNYIAPVPVALPLCVLREEQQKGES